MSSTYIIASLGTVIIIYLIGALRMLQQYERGVVFLLGRFEGLRGPGLTVLFIAIQQMVRVSLRTVTMQIPSQKSSPKITSRSISRRLLISYFRSGESGDRD
jgi:regulator of protease activity HflC (stomatin/prohibitin superfamily)